MAVGWDDVLGIGASVAGGLFSGQAQAKQSAQQLKENRRQFDKSYGLSAGQQAMAAQHNLDTAPLRDKASYLLNARMGVAPQQFSPNDMYNPTQAKAPPPSGNLASQAMQSMGMPMQQQGGSQQPANYFQTMQQAAQAYKPGMGGVDTGVASQYKRELGYDPVANDQTAAKLKAALSDPKVAALIAQQQKNPLLGTDALSRTLGNALTGQGLNFNQLYDYAQRQKGMNLNTERIQYGDVNNLLRAL